MSLGVTFSTVLWALAAIPLVLAITRIRHRALLPALCRAVAAAAVVLGLAGLYVERARSATGTCVVVAIDVSASVGSAALDAARAFLARLEPHLGAHDLVGSVAFAGRAGVLTPPAPAPLDLEKLAPADLADRDVWQPFDTDLAAALTRAGALCPADMDAATILVSDGRETVGSLLAAVRQGDAPARVYAVIPPPTALPVATLRRLLAPTFVPAGSVTPLEAVVENGTAARLDAVLAFAVDDGTPVFVPLDLPPGPSVVALPFRPEAPGPALLQARLLLRDGETLAAESTAVTVTPPLHVVVATARAHPVIAEALRGRAIEVEVVSPRALDRDLLATAHVVVLDDVTRADVAPDALGSIARFVADGGGLVVTGGPRAFGDPALVGTPLARVLPVELATQTPEPQERDPIALELLIDRSNSMGATSRSDGRPSEKMEYARRAALAVLGQLAPEDLVGAIAFDAEPYELAPLRPVALGRALCPARVRALEHGGGTDFRDALELARGELETVAHRVRHVILLTDGDSNRRAADHYQVIDALARSDVTVTTIRIGTDTVNLALLNAISRATGGEFHHVENPEALPQLLVSDARRLMETATGNAPRRVRVVDPGPMLAGIEPRELPPVSRWAITRPKADAEIRLAVDAGERRDPLLATWQVGLGRVAALAMDFQAGAAHWPGWDGFAKLWIQLVRWAAPPALAGARHIAAERRGDDTFVIVETVAATFAPPEVALDGTPIGLAPRGSRRYVAPVPGLAPGPHRISWRTGAAPAEATLRVPALAASARERRLGPPDRALLAEVAARTGGAVDPEPAQALVARPGVRRARTPLAFPLAVLALAAVLADVALRRLAR